jgi:hypothetical protein
MAGLFLATECILEPGVKMSRLTFKEMFENWYKEEGVRQRISERKLTMALKEREVGYGIPLFLIQVCTFSFWVSDNLHRNCTGKRFRKWDVM